MPFSINDIDIEEGYIYDHLRSIAEERLVKAPMAKYEGSTRIVDDPDIDGVYFFAERDCPDCQRHLVKYAVDAIINCYCGWVWR